MRELSPLTRAIRTGIATDQAHGSVIAPVYLSTTYGFEGFDQPREYDYTRCGNPTRDVLADAIATLEGGAGGIITATGTAAMTTLLLQLTKAGDRVIMPHDGYGGTWRLFDELARRGHFTLTVADLTDPGSARAAITDGPAPALVWAETPSNPLMRVTDLRAVADAAHAAGAVMVADNTFLTPLQQRPFDHGADYVVHSTTKYLNGHSDVVGGAVIARTGEQAEELAYWANVFGLTGSPFDSYLTMRGLRTLGVRLRVHEENATAVAGLAGQHPAVRQVHYPGLPGHPQRDIIARQHLGSGGMVSIELAGGLPSVKAFLDGLRCFTLAESLGGTESLVAHPATMTHAAMTPQVRAAAGITDGMLRLSIGLEESADLLADVQDGLDRAAAAG